MIKIIKLFLISVLILAIQNEVFAEQSENCSFKDTSESIVDYMASERKIISNILDDLSWWNDKSTIVWKVTDNLWKSIAKWTKLSNSIFSWKEYDSYFKYHILVPHVYQQDIPYEIKRDLKILQNEWKTLERTLEKITRDNKWSSKVSNLCDWIDLKACPNLWDTSEDAFLSLIANNRKIQKSYIESLLWNNIDQNIFLIDKIKFQRDYNSEIINKYSKDCWFWKRAREKMTEIFNWQSVTREWILAWDEALLRLRCSWVSAAWTCSTQDSAKYRSIEKKLLKNKLRREWISSNMNKKMLKNLEDFNNNANNNDLLWNILYQSKKVFEESAKSVYNWDAERWEDWWFVQDFVSTFDWITQNWFWKKEVVSINALSNTRENSEQTRFIKNTITNLYYEGNNAIWQSATEEVKLQSRIVDIHLNLVKAIEELDDAYKKSKSVCESQWNWLWTCEIR